MNGGVSLQEFGSVDSAGVVRYVGDVNGLALNERGGEVVLLANGDVGVESEFAKDWDNLETVARLLLKERGATNECEGFEPPQLFVLTALVQDGRIAGDNYLRDAIAVSEGWDAVDIAAHLSQERRRHDGHEGLEHASCHQVQSPELRLKL